jgi:ribose transport system ATP-binding protein
MGEFLEIRDISKNYGIVRALKGVSFTIARGEVHALLGENGAGKSTLIRIISGEEIPTSGSLFIDGSEVKAFNPAHAMASGIATVHQELAVREKITALEEELFSDPASAHISEGQAEIKHGGYLYQISAFESGGLVKAAVAVQAVPEP